MFSWYHWLIVLVPLVAVCAFAVHSRKYVRGVADFLAAGRCAGRYLLRSGGMMANTSAVTLISYSEIHCANGWMYAFWNSVLLPVSIMMTFYGWISYRFRETKAMSAGQFFEMRYSRGFRRLAAAMRGSADLLANCIGPAVAVRFLIYLLGLPFRFTVLGHTFRTFPALLAGCLALALLMILAGGRVSLLVTDSIQGLVSYPVFFVLVVFVISRFSFWDEIAPVLADRAPGESFINPYDIQNLRDFNFFGLVVALMHKLLGGAWIGNGYHTVAKSAHEGRMANVIAFFGAGMSGLLPVVLAMAVLCVMNHERHAGAAREIRRDLAARVADELVADPGAAAALNAAVAAVPEQRHQIGVDPPLSQKSNLETPTLEAVHGALLESLPETEANSAYQGFRATYRQQTLPLVLRHVAPPWIVSLAAILIQRNWAVSDALWPVKFPVNSIEISFIAGITAVLLYVAVSLLTCREPFDLDRMLHRGAAGASNDDAAHGAAITTAACAANDNNSSLRATPASSLRQRRVVIQGGSPVALRLLNHLVGITPEFSRGDRIIAWVAFVKHMVIDWVVLFLLCSIAAKAFGWGVREWTMRAFVVWIVYPLVVCTCTTIWFTWGTVIDLRNLFRDLSERKRNDLDNGMVEGHVSLADKR